MGTLAAVIAYFRQDLIVIVAGMWQSLKNERLFSNQDGLLGWYLLLSTIPAVFFGLIFGSIVEKAFDSPTATATFLLLTAGLLILGEMAGKREMKLKAINWLDAVIIGIFQALALFPGVSRSGSTIAGGMLRNLDRHSAARFSFLMSIPVMIAAGILSIIDLVQLPGFVRQVPTLISGTITSTIVGYISIRWLLSYLNRHSLFIFAGYCTLLSAIVWIIALVGR
jgi:undecaprenyl-diphosphatase